MLNRSNVERSNPSGEGQAMRSAGAMPNSAAVQRTNAATARCDSTTPFGRPVEPDVNRITAASSVAQALLPAASALMPTLACDRSEEHTSELQSLTHLVCRLLL